MNLKELRAKLQNKPEPNKPPPVPPSKRPNRDHRKFLDRELRSAELPVAQFGRVTTGEGYVVQRQEDYWLFWKEADEKGWPGGTCFPPKLEHDTQENYFRVYRQVQGSEFELRFETRNFSTALMTLKEEANRCIGLCMDCGESENDHPNSAPCEEFIR